MSKKIVIVGGVAGGATALARLRRLNEDAKILLIEKGEFVSFANCGLPYYIGGVIKSRDSLFVTDIESIVAKYGVEIRNFSELIKIDSENKKILIKDLKEDKTYYETYDKLLLSTGSKAFIPNIKGIESDNVFTLLNIPDTDKVYGYIKENNVKKAVVVGSGFIGIEVSENLKEKGIDVTLLEFSDQVLANLDKDISKLVENELIEKNIDLRLKTGLEEIRDNGKTVKLSNGCLMKTDIIIMAAGVRPNTDYLKDSGVKLNERSGVIVDSKLQTNVEDIYAVGDMIEVTNKVFGDKTMIPLAGIANKQGRAVAANILGEKEELFEGAIGTSILKVFDLAIASTGENEKSLNRRGLKIWEDYGISLIHPMTHASYYPGALPLTLKLIFSLKDGKVLGAQIVGYDGVDKRIDTIATTMHFGGTVYDLIKLELAYAPPFNSAKDPVNMAAYYASDILEGLSTPITYNEYMENKDKYVLVDTREEVELLLGRIDGSINVPLSKMRSDYEKLDKNKDYVLHCAVGLRGYLAERILKQKGYKVRNLLGGYLTYTELDKKAENSEEKCEIEEEIIVANDENRKVIELDVCGLSCPGPIVSVSKEMEKINAGEILLVKATDKGFTKDIESWCVNTNNTLKSKTENKGIYEVEIIKGSCSVKNTVQSSSDPKEKTMIVFDGDLDKAIAAFIIANGAMAMGNKVNMFFTFWGLNILRKPEKVKVKKDFMARMFAFMMPRGADKLGLSKMNFGGMGSKMMKYIMKSKGISSLEELIEEAVNNGVKIIACQMSMDVMGITKEELIDGVEVGGVATMLNDNDNSNMNLFI